MRPLHSPLTAVVETEGLTYPHPAVTATSSCGPDDTCSKLKPYSGDFEANATVILIVLFCALICALTLHTAIRCFLRDNSTPQNQRQQQVEINKPSDEAAVASLVAAAPSVVYSAGMKLTGAETECVICLSEFIEGDVIRVLERCKHGFHVQCIQKWLCSSHYSCPICRRNCLLSPTSTHQNSNGS